MKQYNITLSESDKDIVVRLLTQVVSLAEKNPSRWASDEMTQVIDIRDTVSEATPVKQERKKRTTKSKATKSITLCSQHPNYQARRVPRTDCKECWAAYRKFHPLEYKDKRKAFLRKNKK